MNWFLLSKKCLIFVYLDMLMGSFFDKLLDDKLRKMSFVSDENLRGMLLLREFLVNRRRVRFLDKVSLEGIGFEKLLLVKFNVVKEVEFVKEYMLLLNLLRDKFMMVKFFRRNKDFGKGFFRELL